MRVAIHQLAGKPLQDFVDGEGALLLRHFSVEQHLQQQIAEFSAEFIPITVVDGFEHLDPSRILPAREWQDRLQRGALRSVDLCLTFDDALRCQFDVARPVLELKRLCSNATRRARCAIES